MPNLVTKQGVKRTLIHSYLFLCNPKELFFALQRPETLCNWLADRVEFDSRKKVYTFHWRDYKESAELAEVDNKHLIIRWEWLGEDRVPGEYTCFQVVEAEDDIHTELIIEDVCDEGDEETIRSQWDKTLLRLSRVI
ncbi:MAG: START-like domain-containing protein [Bacteroidia bacterium]